MLIGSRHIIQDRSARTGLHDDIAHLDLKRITLQKDCLLLKRQLLLFRRFILAIVFRRRLCISGIHRQFNRSLLLRYAQTGYQLLVDLSICLYAAQNRHRIMDERFGIIQCPRRIFFAVISCPRLRKKLRQCIA